jgi:hypothetical protein
MPSEDGMAWHLRPEGKVMITSFDLIADMTIIDSSAVAVAQLQLFATEPILVTLPNGEKEEG